MKTVTNPDLGEFLLWNISERGFTDKGQYREVRTRLMLFCNAETVIEEDASALYLELRLLDSLGHYDVNVAAGTIDVRQPYLAVLPKKVSGEVQGVLCGARSQHSEEFCRLKADALGIKFAANYQQSLNCLLPKRIEFTAGEVEDLQLLALDLGIDCTEIPPTYIWLTESAQLPDTKDLQEIWPPGSDVTATWKKELWDERPQGYDKAVFCPNALKFISNIPRRNTPWKHSCYGGTKCYAFNDKPDCPWGAHPEGPLFDPPVLLTRFANRTTNERVFALWSKDQQGNLGGAKVDPDWARFDLLRLFSESYAVAQHDTKYDNLLLHSAEIGELHSIFLAPKFMPLPLLLARAAVQCSGWAPCPVKYKELDYLAYRNVPAELAHLIAIRLAQELTHAKPENVQLG